MSDRTIFCLGGRGHDENVASGLLGFFFDPAAEHGHGELFLEALRECVPQLAFRSDPSMRVARERQTASGPWIDLWMESATSVLVIEHAHWSAVGRSLAVSERCAVDAAARKTGGTVDLIVLGCRTDGVSAPWHYVGYPALIAALRRRLTPDRLRGIDERWRVLTDEFLRHLDNQSREHDEVRLADMLAALRNDDGLSTARRADDVIATLAPFVSRRLAESLGEGCVRTDAWCAADSGHGWRWQDAVDFQMLDRKAADVFVSLAIRHSIAETLTGPQFFVVSWVRPHARRPDVAERCRKRLSASGFEEICPPGVRDWESGRAYDRGLDGATLTEAIATTSDVMRSIREITEGWANPSDPLPVRRR